MTKREMVEKLRRNTCVFGEMPKEEQEMLVEVGKINCLVRSYAGWDCPDTMTTFADSCTYRVSMDYQPPEEAKPAVVVERTCDNCGVSPCDSEYEKRHRDCVSWKAKVSPASRWIECEVRVETGLQRFYPPKQIESVEGISWPVGSAQSMVGFAGMRYEGCETYFMSPRLFDKHGTAYETNLANLEIGLSPRRIVSVRFQRNMLEGK